MLQQSMARGDGLWMFIGDERLLWFHDPTHKEDGTGGILANSIDEGVVEGQIGRRTGSGSNTETSRCSCSLGTILIYTYSHLVRQL